MIPFRCVMLSGLVGMMGRDSPVAVLVMEPLYRDEGRVGRGG
jgi:hypothetical protein